MNFDTYEAEGHALYGALARFIRDQLERKLDATPALPHAQSIQYRRKAPDSLRAKLIQRGKLDSADIGAEIKDLAGVRLIFYGQDDVDGFVKAHVLPELFTVQWEETKVHYPVEENDRKPYIAIHYIVSLNDAAVAQPELAKLAGLRCEIQIQTLLDHAFAETYHDMVYKAQESAGFGTAEQERLDQDMRRIRETYLKPAGYELDKVRRAHRRLMQGKALFDGNILKALDSAADNNVRHELLESVTNHVVPLYDDIGAVYDDIRRSAVAAVKAARGAPAVTRKTAWGDLEGETAASVAQAALTLLDELRYVDVTGSLDALIELYADEPDAKVRGRIVEVAGHLAENNMEAWRQVGPGVQVYLVERLGKLTDDELDPLQLLALTVWQTLLSPSVEGLTSKSDAVVLHKGTVTVSDALRQMRSQAIAGLVRLLDRAKTETQRLQSVNALQVATTGPSQSSYDGALAAIILEDMRAVSDALRARIKLFAYASLERIEEQVFYDYQYAGELGASAKMSCQAQAEAARAAALAFRDALNGDEEFVRYKMLIGFQTVVAPQWDDPDFDFDQVEAYRREQIAGYQAAVTEDTFDVWRPLLARCAATDSNDGATFPLFGDFVREMARTKPSLAPRLLAEPALVQFLPGILNGLAQSKDRDLYRKTFDGYLARGEPLASLAIHLQAQEEPRLNDAQAILKEAIARKDRSAIAQCLVLGMQNHAADPGVCVEQLVVPALCYAVETSDRDQHIDDYLWAAARCGGPEPAAYLDPICDAWGVLPDTTEVQHRTPPRYAVPSQVKWAFARGISDAALDYFIQRAADDSLRWSILHLLEAIDRPKAVLFVAKEIAHYSRLAKSKGHDSMVGSMISSHWQMANHRGGPVMSDESRSALEAMWMDAAGDVEDRYAAFALWAATHKPKDLELLQRDSLPSDLEERIFNQRVARGDRTTVPALVAGLKTAQYPWWSWHSLQRVWSDDLLPILDAELASRAATIAGRPAAIEAPVDYSLAQLIEELSPDVAEALLVKNWDQLHRVDHFVMCAIVVGTPKLQTLARTVFQASSNQTKLMEHLNIHLGLHHEGRSGVTRESQIVSLSGYLAYLHKHEVKDLYDICNRNGWIRTRTDCLDAFLRAQGGILYVDEGPTFAALDEMTNRPSMAWLDHWLKEYADSGASADAIMSRLGSWYTSRDTPQARALLHDALQHVGRRTDLWLLGETPREPEERDRCADTVFAVRRRGLL
jgi:ppGpp synthetase/RelA/SpoT-type nucleotidyltranferase